MREGGMRERRVGESFGQGEERLQGAADGRCLTSLHKSTFPTKGSLPSGTNLCQWAVFGKNSRHDALKVRPKWAFVRDGDQQFVPRLPLVSDMKVRAEPCEVLLQEIQPVRNSIRCKPKKLGPRAIPFEICHYSPHVLASGALMQGTGS